MESNCGHAEHPGDTCARVPVLERLCYFFGQLLEAGDFRAEQEYVLSRLALLTRYAVGWGVACGLDVEVSVGPDEHCKGRPEIERLVLAVRPGIAFDCCGRVIVLRRAYCRGLWELLGNEERTALAEGKPLYVSAELVESPVRPSRASDYGGCDPLTETQYGRIRDETRIRVARTPPEHPTCPSCIGPCGDPGVPLAVVHWQPKSSPPSVVVRTDLRRLLGRHQLATITGLGWVHGATYTRRNAESVLESGIGLRFSRPVRTATLRDGVVDLVVYEGGGGRREAWYVKEVALEPRKRPAGPELCDELVVRAAQPEGFQEGDRILLVFKSTFVLDECCRAVSGLHLGGGVPYDATLSAVHKAHPKPLVLPCPSPPDRSGPWHTGNGTEGGTFESWITVGRDDPRADYETAGGAPAAEEREQ